MCVAAALGGDPCLVFGCAAPVMNNSLDVSTLPAGMGCVCVCACACLRVCVCVSVATFTHLWLSWGIEWP